MRIYVAGHRGMVGSAIVRAINVTFPDAKVLTQTHAELDLLDQAAVNRYLLAAKPDYIFIAAAKVGGIQANNTYRAQFIYENLMIESNLVHGAYQAGVRDLMFLGSSCIYPRDCPQPIREEYLLTGPLEPTNEPYALAKIAGIKLCENYNRQYQTNYVSLMPTNLYGPGDNYDLNNSHVLPALIRKAHEGKLRGDTTMVVWGSGRPYREFLHVDDLAAACLFFMKKSLDQAASGGETLPLLNIGTGQDLTIRDLAQLVLKVVGSSAQLVLDPTKPDGTPKKLLDVSRARALGWQAQIGLEDGVSDAYRDFLDRTR